MKSKILRLTALFAILFVWACQKQPLDDYTPTEPNNGNGNEYSTIITNTGEAIQTGNAQMDLNNFLFLPDGFDTLAVNNHRRNAEGGFRGNNEVEERSDINVNGFNVQRTKGFIFGDWGMATLTGTAFDTATWSFVDVSRSAPVNMAYNDITKKFRWSVYDDTTHIASIPFEKGEKTGWASSWAYLLSPLTGATKEDGFLWHPKNSPLFPNFLQTSVSFPENNATVKFWNLPNMDPTLVINWFSYEASDWTQPVTAPIQDMAAFGTCFQMNEAPIISTRRDFSVGRTYITVPVSGNGNGTETVALSWKDPGGWAKRNLFLVVGDIVYQLSDVYVSSSAVQKVVISHRTKWNAAHEPTGVSSACD